MEGQQLTAIVSELGVHFQQAVIVCEVTKVPGKCVLRAVHLAEIQEGRQGIDLLPLVGLPSKVVGGVSRSTNRGGPEGGDAVVCAGGPAGVTGGDL